VTACLNALTVVPRVHIIDGRAPHILLHEIGDARRVGTMIVRDKAA
jgi:acetylglutamate kinase